MALTRAQLLAGNSSQGTVLPGQVQGVSQGIGVTINASGQISVDASTVVGLVKLNNAGAYNAYVWPNVDGTAGQQLQTDGAGNLSWGDADGIAWTAKGQLVVGTGANTQTFLNVGVNGSILIADSTQASGLAYTGNYVATTGATSAAIIPTGTTGDRPGSPAQGYTRYNTDLLALETYDGASWDPIQNALAEGLGVDITANVAKGYTQTASLPPTVGALPAEAIDGSTYWDDNLGVGFIYYNDGTSSQWVQYAPTSSGGGGGGGGGGGTVTSVNGSGGTTGLTLTGGPVTTSGTLTLGGVLGIANGGTGATTQAAAAAAVLPTQTGNAGKLLTTDGTTTSWISAAAGTVTSVDMAGTDGITVSGNPITTSGTITVGFPIASLPALP